MGKVSRALDKAERGITPDDSKSFPSQQDAPSPVVTHIDHQVAIKTIPPSPARSKATGSLENWDERLLSATESLSGTAESFRKLRTLILYPETGVPARCIMILSAEPQEGKSFVCANLGVSIANDVSHKALLIDCDFRRPYLHNLFGLKGPKGLVDLLSGTEEHISELIIPTGLPNLSIMPAGSPPENPSELVSSEKMLATVKALSSMDNDRLILLDSPPFQVASETLILSQMADKIVLVVRWGKAGREVIKKMAEAVGPEKIIGVVFNAFEMNILDKKMQGVGYHKYYSESYY